MTTLIEIDNKRFGGISSKEVFQLAAAKDQDIYL